MSTVAAVITYLCGTVALALAITLVVAWIALFALAVIDARTECDE